MNRKKQAKRDRDIRFVLNAVILALLALGILHAFDDVSPYIQSGEGGETRGAAVEQQISVLDAARIGEKIHARYPAMVVVWASWCGYCREIMPQVVEQAENAEPALNTVFLSRDRETRKMVRYLVKNRYDTRISLYMAGDASIAEALSQTGYGGHIPYIALFDKEGRFAGHVNDSGAIGELPGLLRKVLTEN